MQQANEQHQDLFLAWDPSPEKPVQNGNLTMVMRKKALLAQVMLEMLRTDRGMAMEQITLYQQFLLTADVKKGEEFETMKDYVPYRYQNAGVPYVSIPSYRWESKLTYLWSVYWAQLRYSMKLMISPDELASIKDLEFLMGITGVLTNDYYSWPRECRDLLVAPKYRLLNAVSVLMREHSLSPPEARLALKQLILDNEREYIRLRDNLHCRVPPVSKDLLKYVDAGGLMMAGYHFWCTTCPRHDFIALDKQGFGDKIVQATSSNIPEREEEDPLVISHVGEGDEEQESPSASRHHSVINPVPRMGNGLPKTGITCINQQWSRPSDEVSMSTYPASFTI
jgi:ophiobolin F synthase